MAGFHRARADQYARRINAAGELLATGMDEAEARRRLAHQMPEDEKVAQADAVIDNSGDLEETRDQVLTAWQALMAALEVGKKKRERVT